MDQFKALRQRFPEDLRSRPTIITNRIKTILFIQRRELVTEFRVVDLRRITMVPVAGNALVRRVHVDPRSERRSIRQESLYSQGTLPAFCRRAIRRHRKLVPACSSASLPCGFTIVGTIIEFTRPVVPDRAFDASGKKIQEQSGVHALVEIGPCLVIKISFLSVLLLPKTLVLLQESLGPFDDLFLPKSANRRGGTGKS